MTKLFAAIMVTCALTACGGGGDNVAEEPLVAPTPLPTVPAVVPDVTFTQVSTNEVVTPGEAFRPVLIAVTCPTMVGMQSCMKTLPLGEIGFSSDLALLDVKIFHDGNAVEGYLTQTGSKYRFTPTGYNIVWQPGVIEVKAILSPTAQDGAKTTMVVQAANASIDTTLSIVSNETVVTVKALPYNAPAIIKPLPEGSGFFYFCPPSVNSGCRLESFNITVRGAAPNSEVQLGIGKIWWYQMMNDSNGYQSIGAGAGYMVHPGETIIVQVMTTPGIGSVSSVSVQFQDIKSMSGDKIITPIAPTTCTPVSSQYCRG